MTSIIGMDSAFERFAHFYSNLNQMNYVTMYHFCVFVAGGACLSSFNFIFIREIAYISFYNLHSSLFFAYTGAKETVNLELLVQKRRFFHPKFICKILTFFGRKAVT